MLSSPLLELNNGTKIPAIGLGVLDRETREQIAGAVEAALAAGYRMIDTAASYLNERDVGEGIVRSGVVRSDIFVKAKLWLSEYGQPDEIASPVLRLCSPGAGFVIGQTIMPDGGCCAR